MMERLVTNTESSVMIAQLVRTYSCMLHRYEVVRCNISWLSANISNASVVALCKVAMGFNVIIAIESFT